VEKKEEKKGRGRKANFTTISFILSFKISLSGKIVQQNKSFFFFLLSLSYTYNEDSNVGIRWSVPFI
jgi:hypothetical protein